MCGGSFLGKLLSAGEVRGLCPRGECLVMGSYTKRTSPCVSLSCLSCSFMCLCNMI